MTTIGEEISTVDAGSFVGENEGTHNAEGQAKVIKLSDGSNLLKLEDLRSTNSPELYNYLPKDKDNSDFVNLGRRAKGERWEPKLQNSRRNSLIKIPHCSHRVSGIFSSIR
jgi:hypothetical protein